MTAARAPKFAPDPARRAMLAKCHLARKDLGLSEEDYRAVIDRVTGGATNSAGSATAAQLDAILDEFQRLGWKAKPANRVVSYGGGRRVGNTTAAADHPSARKARAMWISLWNLGAVRNSSEAALEAFARRQLGVERMQWADQAKCYKLVEALKAMAERAGWQQGAASPDEGFSAQVLMFRLINRQCAILRETGETLHADEIVALCRCHHAPGSAWRHLPMPMLYRIAAELGERVREVRAG